MTTLCRESADALPLIVFHSRQFLQPQRDTNERNSSFRSDCRTAQIKNGRTGERENNMKKLTVAMFALVAAVNMIFAAESVVLRYVIILGLDSYEWQYTLSADGKATVVAAPRTINGRLEVPSHFGVEHPVVGIAPVAFGGRGDIEELILPEGLVEIGYGAFQNCTNLTVLTIPDSVQTMGSGVFGGCTSLEKLTIPFVGVRRGTAEGNTNDWTSRTQFGYMFLGGLTNGTHAVTGLPIWGSKTPYTYHIPTKLVEVIVTDDTLITQYAFSGCEDIKRITFLGGVTGVEASAFRGCTGLESVTFFGNKPVFGGGVFDGVPSSCVILVSVLSAGWGVDVPGTWNGMRIEHIEDALLPEVADDAAVAEAMSGFADAKVVGNVKTLEQYDAFRSWAYAAKLPNGALGGSQAAKEAPYAWQSFALGADKLIGKEITSRDVHVAALEVAGDGDRGAPQFALEVAIDGVNIGGGSMPEAMLKENLKGVLGIEGATSLSADSFSSDNVEIAFDAPENGKARFTVTPPADVDRSFFMRVKVK